MRCVRWALGLAAVAAGCGTTPRPDDPGRVAADNEFVMPMVVTRHVMPDEAAAEAAERGWVEHGLEVGFADGVDIAAGDLVAEYFAQANGRKAHVTTGLMLEEVTADAGGALAVCRAALEPETKTVTEHVPATQELVEVEKPVTVWRLDCDGGEPSRSETHSRYKTVCGYKDQFGRNTYSCDLGLVRETTSTAGTWFDCGLEPKTVMVKRDELRDVPAHDVTKQHRGLRALGATCAPAEPDADGTLPAPGTRLVGTIYVAR